MDKLSGWIKGTVAAMAIMAVSVLALNFMVPEVQASGGPRAKSGYIAAKGLVLGENGKPIWAEFDAQGEVVGDPIGEAVGDLADALVLPAGTYRGYQAAFHEIEQAHSDQRRILYRNQYLNTVFALADGTPIAGPPLREDTWSVVVRTREVMYDRSINLVLHESPLDLVRLQSIPDTARAVLLGKDRRVIRTADVNIGYLTAYYTSADDPNNTLGDRSLWGYRRGEDKLWGPIAGAKVQTSLGGAPTVSDEYGHYVARYFIPPCPGFYVDYPANVFVELRYQHFDPHQRAALGSWYEWRYGWDYCIGYSEGIHPFSLLGGGASAAAAITGIEAGMASPANRINVTIDVAMLTGQASMINEPRPGTPMDSEVIGDIAQGETTQYTYTPPLFSESEPGELRQPDIQPDFSDQGLLKQISREDLENTDIYVYRITNGQLVTSRKGLRPNESNPYYGGSVSTASQSLINYRILMRGPGSFNPTRTISFEDWVARTNVNEELRSRQADHLRIGEQVKVIVINRATGYIGSAVGTYGENHTTGSISFSPAPIVMRPPNLKIQAKRQFEIESGPTVGESREYIIGFEGSGLTSDRMIVVTTEWVDWDGSLLPEDLPGYTGRLAKVVADNVLGQAPGQIANFDIQPGRHTQIVQLPVETIDNAHFYIHVSGESSQSNPGFAEIDFTPNENDNPPLRYRPAKYVPLRVPVFNESATLAAAYGQANQVNENWQPGQAAPILENLEKLYAWPYRPELQFSLFDLEIDELELLTEFDEEEETATTTLKFDYDLFSDLQFDPLDRFGPDRKLLFGLGYAEILTLIGEDQSAEFPTVEALFQMMPARQWAYVENALAFLQPEDYLGLQLYQSDDAGNALVELYGLPLLIADVRPFEIERVFHRSKFDAGIPGTIGAGYTDSYRPFSINLLQPSDVTVKILDDEKRERATVVAQTRLSLGPFNFMLDYQTVRQAGIDPLVSPKFFVELEAVASDGSRKEKIRWPGELRQRNDGKMLGQIVVHDVLIQDGSLTLSRPDMALKGRGPQLAFSRSYSNHNSPVGFKPLGDGWGHSLDLKLRPLSSREYGPYPVPEWVRELKGRFFRNDEIPEEEEEWTSVAVNGTVFIKTGGQWFPERGRHGTLEQVGEALFIYTAKDGRRYYYNYPKREEGTDAVLATDPTHMSIGDGLVTRIGLHPDALRLVNSAPSYEPAHPANPPKPSPVTKIEDRNGNAMTFHYGQGNILEKVVDAVERELTLQYESRPTGGLGTSLRLTSVTGPDDIIISFSYNDKGLLQNAHRDARIETYAYEPETGITKGNYNLVKTTDVNNNSYTYTYHAAGEVDSSLSAIVVDLKDQDVVKRVTYPDNEFAEFEYNAQTANLRRVIDLRGNPTAYTLNYHGNPTKIEEPLGKETRMTWSIDEGKDDNVMTSKTDARGHTTYYEYDTKGNVTLETDPYGNSIVRNWDLRYSVPLERRDRNNVTESWSYDDNGNLEKYVNGDGKEFIYSNYATGERETSKDPRGNATIYTYDQWGNPDTTLDPEGSLTDFEYDIRGRLRASTDPNGNTTQYTYDELDFPDKIIHPKITAYSMPVGPTNVQDFTYDPVGNKITEANRIGLKLTFKYNARDQVETITRNIGGAKGFDYDENGNLLSETDWKGVATYHTYNELNQREKTTNRMEYSMYMGYDLAGNLISMTDYEGNITTHKYDRLNRLTDTWHPELEGQEPGHQVYTYYDETDEKTNLMSKTDPEGNTTTYVYNGRYLRTKKINALNDEKKWEYDDSGNLARETDEEGNYTRYEYDKQNRLIFSYQALDGREIKTAFQFDNNGNQTHVTDARDNTTEIRYDEWNRAYLSIDPDDYTTITEYDGAGKTIKITDGNGHERFWLRDKLGQVVTATDAEGQKTRYTYDPNGNVETITNAMDMITYSTYDAEDRLVSTTEAYGTDHAHTREVLTRDGMGNPITQKDFNGNVTTREYNALNMVKKVIDSFSNTTETTYYRTGKVKAVKNRRGFITTYKYDELNREILATDAKNKTIVTTYDKVGNVKTATDKRNILSENFYDDFYRLVRTVRAGVRLVTNAYDDVDNLTSVTDAKNNTIQYTYNNRNLLETKIFPDGDAEHPDGFTEVRTYDGVANLKTLTDEEEKTTTYKYDKENRQVYVEFAGEVTTRMYDALGNLVSVTKPEGNCRIMAYDNFNRLVTVVDDPTGPIGNMTSLDPRCTFSEDLNLVTSYEYDANDNPTHQYDPGNNHVEFTYDALNRKTAHIQHKQGGNLVTSYTRYDAEGNLEEMIDANGRTFTYSYDELNRQTDQYFPDTGAPYLTITHIHTEYDENNNVIGITENKKLPDDTVVVDTTVNIYDDFDRLDDSTQRGLAIDHGYDANGNRTLVSTPAGSTTYTFDSRNRLKTAVVGSDVTSYTYTPDSKQATVTYPNGTEVKYTYYDTNMVETVTNKVTATGTIISSYEYDYSPNGNRIEQIEVQDGVSETTIYDYDAVDRLIGYTVTGVDTTVTTYTFEAYNRKTEKVTKDATVVKARTYTYDETNWLTAIQDDTDSGNIFTIDYDYDNNGNTILKTDSSLTNQDVNFTYDSRNQMVQVIRGQLGIEELLGQYDYNADGLRVRHRYSERGDVDYYYDDTAIIEEHNANDDSLMAHYRYADRLISLYTGASTQYYHHDAMGSTVNLTTESAAVQVSYRLDPWGHIRSQTGDSINRKIFTGQEHDNNTGLIYFGARYYDPDTARFITQDSYLGTSSNPPSLHRYMYAYNNPSVYWDPTGNETEEQYTHLISEAVAKYQAGNRTAMGTAGELHLERVLERTGHKIIKGPANSPGQHNADVIAYDPETKQITFFDNKIQTKKAASSSAPNLADEERRLRSIDEALDKVKDMDLDASEKAKIRRELKTIKKDPMGKRANWVIANATPKELKDAGVTNMVSRVSQRLGDKKVRLAEIVNDQVEIRNLEGSTKGGRRLKKAAKKVAGKAGKAIPILGTGVSVALASERVALAIEQDEEYERFAREMGVEPIFAGHSTKKELAIIAGEEIGGEAGGAVGAAAGAACGPAAWVCVPVGAVVGGIGGDYVGGKLAKDEFERQNRLSDEEKQKLYLDAYERNKAEANAQLTVEKRD